MPVAFVQEADAASTSVTLGANATAGNTLIVAVACLGSTPATGVTGVTLGGSPDNFALIAPGPSAHDTTSPNDYLNVSVWADANCAGGATAIAVTGTGVVAAWAYEFSGLAGTPDIAQVLAVGTYQDSWLASTAQTTVPAEAWIAITAAANQTSTPTPAVATGNGWSTQSAHSGTVSTYDWGGISAYQTVNTVGTPSFNGSFSQASFSTTAIVTLGAGTPPAAAVAAAPLTGNVTVRGGSLNVHGALAADGVITQGGTPVGLTPVGPKTGNYTAKPGDFVIVNTATASTSITITFPAGAPTGSLAGVKLANVGLGFPVTVQASGSDVFDILPASTTGIQLSTAGATFIAQYKASTGTWYIQSASYTEPGTLPATPGIGLLPAAPAANSLLPADLALVTWSYDPAHLTSPLTGTALASGTIYLVMCPVRSTAVLSNGFSAWITSGGSGLTSSRNFVGVYDPNGNRLAVSADVTSAFGSPGAFSTGFVVGDTTIGSPYVWAAFLSNGTTPPSFARTVNQAGVLANGALAAPNVRFGTVSGSFTSLPSSFDTGLVSTAATAYFVALY